MTAYYNEFDPKAAAWLRELISRGLIAPGDVDERDIRDVTPSELVRYTQCHFFAGIGVWSYALRNAGWPDDRPVWTGSCPCQPFSTAGTGDGFADERHLWPFWHYLISQCQPPEIYGEQVADGGGEVWLDLVLSDLEGSLYAAGAVDICAAGLGSPNIRQRLYFKAERMGEPIRVGLQGGPSADLRGAGRRKEGPEARCSSGSSRGLADPDGNGHRKHGGRLGSAAAETQSRKEKRERLRSNTPNGSANGRVADTNGYGRAAQSGPRLFNGEHHPQSRGDISRSDLPSPTNGFWGDADWLLCRDPDGPAWRPVEPGTFPLANGAPARMGRLRGYGNAINAQVAQAVIEVSM